MRLPERRLSILCRILRSLAEPGSNLVRRAGLFTVLLFGTTAFAGTPQVNLSWIASAGSPSASGYNVYRGQTSGTYPSGWSKVNIGLVSGTSFVDTIGLQTGTYYFVVTAVNTNTATCSTGNCESGPSNQVGAVITWPKQPAISGVFK